MMHGEKSTLFWRRPFRSQFHPLKFRAGWRACRVFCFTVDTSWGALQLLISSCWVPQLFALPSFRQNALVWPSRWHFLEHLGGPGIYGLGMNLIPFRKISLGAGPSNSKATVGVSILVGPLSVLNR